MIARIKEARGAILAIAISALASGGMIACTHDFDAFAGGSDEGGTSTDGGSKDSSSGGDAVANDTGGNPDVGAVDTGIDAPPCTPSASCLNAAVPCGYACAQDAAACIKQCGGNMGCRNQCRTAEGTCLSNCNQTCVTCTTSAGCAAPSDCANSVDAGANG